MASPVTTGTAGPSSRGMVRWSRARRTAIVVVDGALAVGTGAVAGLLGGAPGGAATAHGIAPTSGWTGIKAPLPTGPDAPAANPEVNGQLAHISCASAVSCVGVGSYSDAHPTEHALLETYSHGSWSGIEAPLPGNAAPGAFSIPEGVSCATDGTCVAVGGYNDTAGGTDGFIDTLSGGTWTSMEAPVPGDSLGGSSADTFLKSVDCRSASMCVAVGGYRNAGGETAFVDTLAGGAWSGAPLPAPAGVTPTLTVPVSVACPSVGSCVATGVFETTTLTQQQAYVMSQVPGGWSAQVAPLPGNVDTTKQNEFVKSSCGGGICEVSGFYKDSSNVSHGVYDTFANGGWSTTGAPVPADISTTSPDSALLGVSCTFDGCVSVGAYLDTAGGTLAYAVTSPPSGAPTAAKVPLPADAMTGSSAESESFSVSCLSLNECTSVGTYATAAGGHAPLIDNGSAGTWTNTVAPLPNDAASGSSEGALHFAVSCENRGSCAAFGVYNDTSGHSQGLLANFTPTEGYWSNASDGGVFTYGSATFHGSAGNLVLNKPVVGMAATPGDGGYWEVATDGGIFSYGDAIFHGSTGAIKLNQPVVGMAATPDGGGYWLVASDGGIFSYGDAQFFGSTGAIKLNQPVVGMAATPDGQGYWLVASDGGIFSYGDAQFYGSRGGQPLNKPIVGMAATATGQGYWLVASDGGIFSYGDAQFYGSTGAIKLNKPIVSMMSTFDGAGYWLVASDGGIFNYGDAGFYGSAGNLTLNKPVVNGAPS
jgi:hypothetical protein